MTDYPTMIATVNHIEPVPRRIRATVGAHTILDTTRAAVRLGVAELPAVLHPARRRRSHSAGRRAAPAAGSAAAPPAGTVFVPATCSGPAPRGCTAMTRYPACRAWSASNGTPWTPGSRRTSRSSSTPAIRTPGSTRSVRPERSASNWTGWCWPSRARRSWSSRPACRPGTTSTAARSNFDHLIPTQTQTACPYKGTTSGYWSIRIGDTVHADLAWAYDFPTRQLLPIAGMIAFYNEKVDIFLDGELLERPTTHFFK